MTTDESANRVAELQAIARYVVQEGKEAELESLLPSYAEIVRTEPGNLSFEVYRSIDGSRRYLLLERYQSRQAFERHCETEHFTSFVIDRFIPILAERTVELQNL